MKNIKPVIYENLTPQQRIVASIEAQARDDDEERIRLIKTCPKKTYSMNDHAFCAKIDALQDIAIVIECDMRGCALNFFMLLFLDDNLVHDDNLDREKYKKLHEAVEKAPDQIQHMIGIKQAWHEILGEEGIDPALMDKAYKPMVHHAVAWATVIADHLDLEPDPEVIEHYKEILREYLDKCQ